MDDLDQEIEEMLGALHDTSFVPWVFDNLNQLTSEVVKEPVVDPVEKPKKPQATGRLFANALSAVSRRSDVDVPRKVRLERMERRKESEEDTLDPDRSKKRGMPYPAKKPSLNPAQAYKPDKGISKETIAIDYRPMHPQPSTMVVCTFWPHCTRTGCHFYHPPSQMCPHWPHCRNPNCQFMHPESTPVRPCKWGLECTNINCAFGHPEPNVPPCKFGEYCQNPNCTFYHAEAQYQPTYTKQMCRFDANCTNANCTFIHSNKIQSRHLSQRFFATEDVQEKVPAPR